MAEQKQGFTAQKPVGKFANSDTSVCPLTRAEAIAEIEREANVRMKCYDRWVAEGKMTQDEATKRMGAIVSAWHFLSDTDQARQKLVAETQA